jgi:hypothetical protein
MPHLLVADLAKILVRLTLLTVMTEEEIMRRIVKDQRDYG